MKLNVLFLIFFIIACIAFISDILIYVFKANYLLGLIISSFFCIVIFGILICKKKLEITFDLDTDI